MGRMSRTKGAAFECLIVRLYRERFGWDPRECYRSAPLQAAAGDRAGDITTPMPIWHELSHAKGVSQNAKLRQAEEACPVEVIPVAVTRRDRQIILVTLFAGSFANVAELNPDQPLRGGPIVTMQWDDWLNIIDSWWTGIRR